MLIGLRRSFPKIHTLCENSGKKITSAPWTFSFQKNYGLYNHLFSISFNVNVIIDTRFTFSSSISMIFWYLFQFLNLSVHLKRVYMNGFGGFLILRMENYRENCHVISQSMKLIKKRPVFCLVMPWQFIFHTISFFVCLVQCFFLNW